MRELLRKINIAYLAIIFLWHTLQITYLEGFDGKGRVLIFSSVLVFFINITKSKRYRLLFINKQSVIKIRLIWVVYAVVNSMLFYGNHKVSLINFIAYELFVPFIVMSVIASFFIKSIKYFLSFFLILLYGSFLLLFINTSFVGGRFNLTRFDPNELSLSLILLVSVICLNYIIGKFNVYKTILLLILPLAFIVFLGSRMGFGCVMILLIGMFVVSDKYNRFFNPWKILLLIPVCIISLDVILNNTVLGERILSTSTQSEGLTINPAAGTIFESFGDRGVYYVQGWAAFLDSPMLGIGLKNFMGNYWSTVNHVEYLIHLSELGIIGAFFYLLFLRSIYLGLKKRKVIKGKIENKTYKYLFFIFGALVFAGTVLYLYDSIYVSALFGILILFTKKETFIYMSKVE